MSLCVQLAWRGTLLQVPEDLLRLGCGVRKCELGVRWGLGRIQRAVTGRFRTEVYGPCCGYLSRSPAPVRNGFLNAHRMSQWDRRAKAVAEGKGGLPMRGRSSIK